MKFNNIKRPVLSDEIHCCGCNVSHSEDAKQTDRSSESPPGNHTKGDLYNLTFHYF